LALRYRHLRNIFFIRAHDSTSLDRAFLDLANVVGHDLLEWQYQSQDITVIWRDLQPPERVQAFRDWLGTQENEQTLFMIDDIDGLMTDSEIEAAIPSEAKVVLYSTRDPTILRDFRPADKEISVSTLDPDEMAALMTLLLKHTRYLRQDPLAEEALASVAKAVRGHALAACRAVQYIDDIISQTSESPIGAFLAIMNGPNWKGRKEFLEYKPRAGFSVMETFEISLKRLRRNQSTTIRLLQLLSFLNNFEGSLDFRKFFAMDRPWLMELEDDLPDVDLLSKGMESHAKYLAEMENVSIGLRASRLEPLKFHAIWLECVHQGMDHDDRLRWLRQVLLLCDASIAQSENVEMITLFRQNALHIAAKFDIKPDSLVPSSTAQRWLETHRTTQNGTALNTAVPSALDPDGAYSRGFQLRQQFSRLIDDVSRDPKLIEMEESRSIFQQQFLDLLKELKRLDDEFQASTIDSGSTQLILSLYDSVVDICLHLKNGAMAERMRNIQQRFMDRVNGPRNVGAVSTHQ
jgi:hypothetical protein